MGVFRPDSLGRLVRRRPGRGRAHIEVALRNGEPEAAPDSRLAFRFSTNSQRVVVEAMPKPQTASRPVFLPTRELLTVHPGLIAHYETHHLDIEETWVDTCKLLQLPALRGPRLADIAALLEPVERAMGGKVVLDHTGRFYLRSSHGATLEMPLVAEGHRKFATLAQLLVNGSLLKQGFLFWDEPDANLNPILIRQVAEAILNICRGGVQTFIATHSLFLLSRLWKN